MEFQLIEPIRENIPLSESIENMSQDLEKMPLLITASRGSGKSTLTKKLVKRLREKGCIVKVFDISGSWYNSSPLSLRVRVNLGNLSTIQNKPDTVYDLLELDHLDRLAFFACICKQDLDNRARIKYEEGETALSSQPLIIYVLEEANTYLSTHSLTAQNQATNSITDMVSVGRNFKISFIGIVTRSNEVNTKIRERANLLIGRTVGSNEASNLTRATNKLLVNRAKELPPFKFIYFNGYETTEIRGEFEQFPEPTTDYPAIKLEPQPKRPIEPKTINWLGVKLAIGLGLLIAWLLIF